MTNLAGGEVEIGVELRSDPPAEKRADLLNESLDPETLRMIIAIRNKQPERFLMIRGRIEEMVRLGIRAEIPRVRLAIMSSRYAWKRQLRLWRERA